MDSPARVAKRTAFYANSPRYGFGTEAQTVPWRPVTPGPSPSHARERRTLYNGDPPLPWK
jgi:hypothetical protein